jgi:hypothetical protein
MLLHGELWWLLTYYLVLAGGIAAAVVVGLPVWMVALIGVVGVPAVFFGWLFQVGQFG